MDGWIIDYLTIYQQLFLLDDMIKLLHSVNLKGLGRKWPWLNSRYYPSIHLERLRKIMKASIRVVSVVAEI
jgi:hypothetical protein